MTTFGNVNFEAPAHVVEKLPSESLSESSYSSDYGGGINYYKDKPQRKRPRKRRKRNKMNLYDLVSATQLQQLIITTFQIRSQIKYHRMKRRRRRSNKRFLLRTKVYSRDIIIDPNEEEQIDCICDFRIKADFEVSRKDVAENFMNVVPKLEFLTKWKHFSHLHNTWDTNDSLKPFKGFKKVDIYFKKTVLPYLEIKYAYSNKEVLEQVCLNV